MTFFSIHWHELVTVAITAIIGVIYVLEHFKKGLPEKLTQFTEPKATSFLAMVLIALLAVEMEFMYSSLRQQGDAVQSVTTHLRDHIDKLQLDVNDPVLADIYAAETTKLRRNADHIPDHGLEIADIAAYPAYYKRTLDHFAGHAFYAVTIPGRDVWKDPDIYVHMAKFIAEGGSIRRVFLLESTDELSTSDKAVINRHLAAKVDVWIVKRSYIDKDSQKPLLVEKNGEFGWEADVGPQNELTNVFASTARKQTQTWLNRYTSIIREATHVTQPF